MVSAIRTLHSQDYRPACQWQESVLRRTQEPLPADADDGFRRPGWQLRVYILAVPSVPHEKHEDCVHRLRHQGRSGQLRDMDDTTTKELPHMRDGERISLLCRNGQDA
jgi:hypothetical protein